MTASPVAAPLYTCPMHPQVRQTRPGPCPICGMALEPVTATATDPSAADPELADMTRRFRIAAALGGPVVVLAMGGHLAGPAAWLPERTSAAIQFVLSTPVVLWAGLPIFQRGWTSVRSGHLNMFTLIALGTSAAYGYSVLALLAPGLFPAEARSMGGAVPVYFEAASMIVALVLLGQALELRARAQTGGALRALLDLTPRTAQRWIEGRPDEAVPLDAVRVGDRLRVRPGDTVPVDGEIVEGRSDLDESLITGESLPVARTVGAAVVAGAINGSGAFVMRADRVGSDTLLAQIVRMVGEAQRSRAPIQALADRVSGAFVPAVIGAALLAALAWAWLGPAPRLGHALLAGVSVLIVACPCALGLATPLSIRVGVGRGARAGLLIRNAEALERLDRVDTLVVDKTGTLTEGRPAVIAVDVAPGFDADTVLRLAASLERSSGHPLAQAVLRAAADRHLSLAEASRFDSPAGRGVTGEVEGRRVAVGNADFIREQGAATGIFDDRAQTLGAQGATALFISLDGTPAGLLGVADPIKATTPAALKALKAQGLRVVMMTGDHRVAADAVARTLGLDAAEADILPAGKAERVRRMRAEGRVVAMVGDGVNDAPALAAADVGVAMGAGADVALESAGITLLGGDLMGLVRARALSRAVMRNIRENLAFAFVYNAAAAPIAAGALYPAFHILLSPQIAAGAMALSSLSVIGNALRLRTLDLPGGGGDGGGGDLRAKPVPPSR